MELELKLLIDGVSTGPIESHPAFVGGKAFRRKHLTTTYYDTPDLALRQRGTTLRVRRSGKSFVQTVKCDDPQAVLGERGEWEWPVGSAEIDIDKLAELPPGLALVKDIAARVEPLFLTDVDRRTWLIELEGGTAIEAAIDRGVARAGASEAAINELELELKEGTRAPLIRLAIDLCGRADLRYGAQSKAERGYHLLAAGLPPRRDVEPLRLPEHASIADVFPRLVNGALVEFAADMAAAGDGDVEGVHRLRAAIRKLRTLLVLFGPDLESEATSRFKASLRELGTVLGRGRDWDVFLTETLRRARADSGEASLDLLIEPARARRDAAHAAIRDTMLGPGPTRLLLGLAAWTSETGWLSNPAREVPLRAQLPHTLGRIERRVVRRARHSEDEDAETLHDLRKAMKKLRYSAEDVGSLFKSGPVERYVRAVKATLSVLGEINDASVAIARAGDVAPPDRPELAPAAAILLGWNEKRLKKALDKLQGKLRKFKASKPFWT